ncbi:MAG: VOC family protein [Chloroflexi bacterium]|nr:VOC family protein [Chloroflexota bacterium]
MTTQPLFKAARPYQDDVLALPVEDLDQASQWYANALGLTELERRDDPVPTVIMQRDGVQIGFAINGGDASNDGAAILVTDIDRARRELEAGGLSPGESRIDDHGGQKMSVFFLVAPDGLCFYFHQPID